MCHIASFGNTSNIPLIQTVGALGAGIYSNFYIVHASSLKYHELWNYYNNETSRFKKEIKQGPFEGYTLNVTWKYNTSILQLLCGRTCDLFITLNKPSDGFSGWIRSFF